MNRVSFGESACERTRKYLDSYISNELLVETNHEVLRHLEDCAACSAEVEIRSQLRTRVRVAVRSQEPPPELPALVRERIRAKGWQRSSLLAWARWPAVATVGLAAGLAIWVNVRPERLPDVADRPAQNTYIQKISSRMAAVLRVGLGDHLHCSVFRKRSATIPTVAEMEKQLGPSYEGLLPVVSAAAPDGYRVVMAHHCSYLQRKFVHLTLANDRGSLLSLVIARKQDGESLAALVPEVVKGTPIYGSAAGRYQVASFDAGNFLAYVVSDMSGNVNREVASAMAPGVREVLTKIAG